jgi:hypothetical protein
MSANTSSVGEQAYIGHIHGAFRQAAHASLQAVIGDFLQARSVDHGESQVPQTRRALAQVAGHTGLVIDQRKAFAHKAVKQCRFAHIGAADDGKGQGHGGVRAVRSEAAHRPYMRPRKGLKTQRPNQR